MAQNLRVNDRTGNPNPSPSETGAIGASEQSVARLVGDIVGDAQKLVRQEISLARVELNEEWQKVKLAAVGYAAAMVLGVVTVFLLGMSVAQILIAIGVTAWLSYTLVTLLFGGIAYAMMRKGMASAKHIDFVPRQTVETMKENVQWMRNQK